MLSQHPRPSQALHDHAATRRLSTDRRSSLRADADLSSQQRHDQDRVHHATSQTDLHDDTQPAAVTSQKQPAKTRDGVEHERDEHEERPSKRARFDTSANTTTSSPRQPTNEHVALGFPAQPRHRKSWTRSRGSAGENPARRADDLQPPPMATVLYSDTAADFRPWTGHDAEDVINEQVIKGGYCDKGPSPNQNESGTARASVWPSLTSKNNVALHSLSWLYAQVLDRRQSAGRVTAPSTFKPPPRVTVTDAKREAWLRDLANPSVPLKKQSRTIPHGIRGKVLLEQCLLKSVPLQRAVWLAKCVGANELRAFRRKGIPGAANAQGESKWIREWTVAVTQFLHDALRSTPGGAWRARMQYTVKFVAALFGEGLLERDCFLDWLVSTLKGVSLDQLPVYLLLVRIFWRDIVVFEQRGRQVVLYILDQLRAIRNGNTSIYEPIRKQLQAVISAVSKQAPGCLVIPRVWPEHEQAIFECLTPAIAESVRFRNERLAVPSAVARELANSPARQLYALLDQVGLDIDLEKTTLTCSTIMSNTNKLVAMLLQWTGSRYRRTRTGNVLVQEILQRLAHSGHDIDSAVLNFVAGQPTQSDGIVSVICALFRAECLSSGRFMQWLIASGVLSSGDRTKLPFRLLLSLPTDQLSQHLLNTRSALLARAGYLHDATQKGVVTQLEACLEQQKVQLDEHIAGLLPDSSIAADVSRWARSKSVSLAKDNSLTVTGFCLFRSIYEALKDTAALHALLELAALTEDFRVIGAAADTINTHAQDLAVLSALQPLTKSLVERYRVLRRQQSLERSSIYALRNLVKDLGNNTATVRFLNGDIAVYEQQSLNNVCSPASDNLIGMHAGSMDSDGEIEAVFASGNTMDENLLHRVFKKVMQQAEEHGPGLTALQSRACRWLVQLRMLDRGSFDKVASGHAHHVVTAGEEKALRSVYALIAADCFGFEALLQSLGEKPSARSSKSMLSLLAATLPADLMLNPLERYHLEHQRLQFRLQQSGSISKLLQQSLQLPNSQLDLDCMSKLLVELPSDLFDAASEALSRGELTGTTFKLLCSRGLASDPSTLTASKVVEMADHLNLGFCIGWLRCLSSSEDDSIKEALIRAIVCGSPVWPQLLQSTSDTRVRALHDWAFEQLVKGDMTPSAAHMDRMSLCSTVLDITFDSRSSDDHISGLSLIALRLRAFDKFMNSNTPSAASIAQFRLLLHVIILLTRQITKTEAHLQSLTHIVLALCALLAQEKLQGVDGLIQYVYDVTSQVVDKLPAEVLPRLLKSLGNAGLLHKDVQQLLGSASDETDLVLSLHAGGPQHRTLSRQQSQTSARTPTSTQQGKMPMLSTRQSSGLESHVKYAPYTLRKWEMMQDPTPVVGENDSSINLSLFGARRV